MKKPFLQRKWVWVVIVIVIGIGYSEIKSSFRAKEKEVSAEKVLKDKVRVPDPLFKTKDEVKAEFERIGLKPKFVVSNFDNSAVSRNRFLRKNECNSLSDGSGAVYLSSKEVGSGKSGYYAKKGDKIIVGYSDHDFDGTKNSSTTKESLSASESSSINSITAPTEKDVKKPKEPSESKSKEPVSDITKLADEPTTEQQAILDTLAQQQFDAMYPYKGSKMHTIIGVIQPWTQSDGAWYRKVEATIVNSFGAKSDANVEIHIIPESATTGNVEIIAY